MTTFMGSLLLTSVRNCTAADGHWWSRGVDLVAKAVHLSCQNPRKAEIPVAGLRRKIGCPNIDFGPLRN